MKNKKRKKKKKKNLYYATAHPFQRSPHKTMTSAKINDCIQEQQLSTYSREATHDVPAVNLLSEDIATK